VEKLSSSDIGQMSTYLL